MQSTTSSTYPHLSHQHPWAHNFICCDQDHQASTSSASGGDNQFQDFQPFHTTHKNADLACNDTDACHSDCPLETYCRGGDYCCNGDHGECGGAVECCTNPGCEEMGPEGTSAPAGCDGHSGCGSLAEWADTKEGCHAIEQLLECCNQPDCDLPVCTKENETVHPPPVDPLVALFESMASQPIANPLPPVIAPVSQIEATSHTCHWGNCHLIFRSMPDLLAHVAADHLSAWGSNAKPTPVAQIQEIPPQQMPPLSFATPTSVIDSSSMGVSSALQTPASMATDQLLSCLWDDCFPPNDFAPTADTFHHHQHSQPLQQQLCHEVNHVQHNQPHTHDHTTANGEPFSPGTMLRHVLEEHLGVPGEIIGWPNEQPQSEATGPSQFTDANGIANPYHHHHHVQHHQHHLPTPPLTEHTSSSSSPPPSLGRSLICLWPGCPIHTPFPDSATLMNHLSEIHIPKGKDSYTCHWDGCGGESGKVFKSRQKVLRHLQSHVGHKPFVCGVCDQGFSEAAPLAAHMRRHAQEKPFKCDHPGCGKTFAISSSLTIHMRTHNGEKPFVCQYCNKGFVEASNLTKHIRTHTGERPFACAHIGCGKRFSRPDQLKRHMAVHDRVMGIDKRKILTA